MQHKRKLGVVLATGLVAGNMIGSGIFLLPATLASIGGVALIGWLFAAFGALVLALLFGRLADRHPLAGGPASYVFADVGAFAGFQATICYWAACLIGNVAIATAAAGYLGALVPSLTGAAIPLAAIGLLWLLALANFVSPRFVGQLDGLLLIAGLVPLLLIATVGWLAFDVDLFRDSWNPSGQSVAATIPSALVLVFWAFTGMESACVAAAVVEDPQRNIPIATLAGVAFAALVYISASTVMTGLVPASELAASSAPFALAAARTLGHAAGPVIAAFALFKTLGTLAGWVLLTAQVSRAAAERGLLPVAFARVSSGDTPILGLIAAALLGSLAILLTISPTLGEQFGILGEASTVFALLTYAGACGGAVLRGERSDIALALVGGAFCVVVIAGSSRPALGATALAVVITALVWPLVRKRATAAK